MRVHDPLFVFLAHTSTNFNFNKQKQFFPFLIRNCRSNSSSANIAALLRLFICGIKTKTANCRAWDRVNKTSSRHETRKLCQNAEKGKWSWAEATATCANKLSSPRIDE